MIYIKGERNRCGREAWEELGVEWERRGLSIGTWMGAIGEEEEEEEEDEEDQEGGGGKRSCPGGLAGSDGRGEEEEKEGGENWKEGEGKNQRKEKMAVG